MIKHLKLVLFLILVFNSTSLKSQSIELKDLLADAPFVCEDVNLNIVAIAKQYLEADQLDSLQILAEYWEAHCGSTEPVVRFSTLVSIANGKFNDSKVNDTLMNYVIAYLDRLDISSSRTLTAIYSKLYMKELGHVPLNREYDKFTSEMAEKLFLKAPPETSAYLLTLLYSNNSALFLKYLNSFPYHQLHFGEIYHQKKKTVARRRDKFDYHVLRIWVPYFFQYKPEGIAGKAYQVPGIKAKMVNRTNNCLIVSKRISDLVVKYRRSNQLREIGILLEYWKNFCGVSEPIYRLEKIWALENEKLADSTLEKNFFYFAEMFELRINPDLAHFTKEPKYYPDEPYKKNNAISDEFDLELLDWAKELLYKQDAGSFSYLIALFYSGQFDEFYKLLQSDAARFGVISAYYEQEVNEADNIADLHMSASAGAWFPTNKLAIVGSRPTLGLHVGIGDELLRYDLTLEASVYNQSRNPYETFHLDQLKSTGYFSYAYLGLENTMALVHSRSSQIQLLSGLGYSEVTTIQGDPKNEIPAKSLGSLNINAGIGFQSINKKGGFAALQVRYNLTFLQNKEGSDLDGQILAIRFLVRLTGTKYGWQRRKFLRSSGV